MKKTIFILIMFLAGIGMLEAQNTCLAPSGLTASPHTPNIGDVTLNWEAPQSPSQQILSWATPAAASSPAGWGSSSNGAAAIRFTTTDLQPYSGYEMTAVSFIPALPSYSCTYTIRIWEGGSVNETTSAIVPGNMVSEQVVTQNLIVNTQNVVRLTRPYTINPSREVWVGISCQITTSGMPIYVGTNTVVPFKNLWVNNITESWEVQTTGNYSIFGILERSDYIPSGYKVYRDGTLLTSSTITQSTYVDNPQLNGLYEYGVTSVYANGCESQPVTLSLQLGNPCMLSSLPYWQNFDGYVGNTATTVASHVLPECWSYLNEGTTNPGLPSTYASESYAQSGVNSIRFNVGVSATDGNQYAILPKTDNVAYSPNMLKMEFDARSSSETNPFNLAVGVMSDPTDPTTFQQVALYSITSTNYTTMRTDFSNFAGNGNYVALKALKGTVANTGYVDNVILGDANLLPKPDSVVASNMTTSSVTLAWRENGSAGNWVVEYGPKGFTLGTGDMTDANATHTVVSGLMPGTSYDFYVRSLGVSNDTSAYSWVCQTQTACDMLTSLPYMEDFDSWPAVTGATSVNNLPNCWQYINTGTNWVGYPAVFSSSTYAHSGLNSIRFYSTTVGTNGNGDQYAILPRVDVSIYPINTLELSFIVKRLSTASYGCNLNIGVMTDPADASTFTSVATVSLSSSETGFESRSVSFANYSGSGQYIAIKLAQPSSNYNVAYVDDIQLGVNSTCSKPTSVRVTDVTENSATVRWTPTGSESRWDVVVVPADDDLSLGMIMTTTTNEFTYTNLNPSTDYCAYVRANCGSDQSQWTFKTRFTTRCDVITTLPYSESFDTYGTATSSSTTTPGPFPPCWTRRNTNTSNVYPFVSSTYKYNGVGSLYMCNGGSSYYTLAISEAFDLSSYSGTDVALSFKVLRSSTSNGYGRVSVGIMTNPDDMSTFTSLKDLFGVDFPAVNTWYEHIVKLPYTNRPFYLAVYQPALEQSYAYIDDIKIDVAPTCMEPSSLRVNEITGSSAKLTWTPAPYGVSDYVVEYSVAGSNNWSSPQTVHGASFRLTELQPSTHYDVRVYSSCQYGTGTPLELSFSTFCAVPNTTAVGTGTTNTAYVPAYSTYKYSYSQQIYLASEMQGAQDISSISFQYAGTSSAKRDLTIYLMHTTATSIPSWLSIETAQKVFDGTVVWEPNTENSGWNTILLDSVFHYNGTSNLVLIVDNNSTETGGTSAKSFKTHTSTSNITRYVNTTSLASVDNFNPYNMLVAGTGATARNNIRFTSCNNVTCVPPVAWFTDISSTSVTIDLSPGNGETEWLLEYKKGTSSTWTSAGNIHIHPYSLGNLTPSTDYQFRLSSSCGTSFSTEKTILNAHTPCTEISIPYFDGFETYGTPSTSTSAASPGLYPPCWMSLCAMDAPYPYIYANQHYSGAGCLYMNGTSANYCYAILPPLEASVRMDSLQIKFFARKTSNSYYVEVGIMSDPNNRSTFERVGICYPLAKDNWELMEFFTTSYAGNGRYIAFRTPSALSQSIMYLDDIDIKYKQGCMSVNNINALEIHHDEATITWSPRGMEGNWNYVYGPKDSVDLNNAAVNSTTTNTAVLTNLTSQTDYDVFIQADCGSNSLSDWMKYTFSTPCSPIASLPYIENFDSYTVTGTAYLTDCWTKSTDDPNPYPYRTSMYAASVPNAIYFANSTAASYSMAIMQEMDPSIAINTLQVTFKTYAQSSYLSTTMTVGVISNPSDINTFVPIATFHNTTGNVWESHTASLTSYTGLGRHIAFKAQGTQILLDDVFIDLVAGCGNPSNVSVSQVDRHSATVSWTPVSGVVAYELYPVPYGHNSSVSDVTPVVVTSSPCTLAGLTAGTNYTLYIRSVCANNAGYSNFVQALFETECEPINQMPWFEDFDGEDGTTSTSAATNNLPLCWNYINEGGANYTSYNGYPIVFRGSTLAQSAPNAIRFDRGTSTNYYADQYAILPEIDTTLFPIQTLELSFDARKGNQTYPSMTLIVGVMTDTSNFLSFRPVDTVSVTNTTYDHYTVFMNKYQETEGRWIAIAAKLLPNGTNSGYVDNIGLAVSAVCMPVDRPVLTQASPHTLTIQWGVNGSETDWKVQYKPVADSVWAEDEVSVNPYTISNLLANTEYEIQVLAVCGQDFYSIPSQTLMASTDCEPLDSLPYAVNFDNYLHTNYPMTGASNVPSCWHALNSGTSYSNYPYVSYGNEYAQSGNYSLQFWVGTSGTYSTQYAVLPEVDPTLFPVNELELSFDVRAYSVYGSVPTFTCLIGLMSDYFDENTFEVVDSLVITTEVYQHYRIFFNNYTGNGRFLTIKVPKLTYNNQGCFDNIVISHASSCLPVDNVTVSNIDNQSAVLTWHPNGTETAWNIRYRPVGDTAWSVSSATTTTVTLTGLTSNTIYEVQIQASCNSDWSASVLFETECNDRTQLPYVENFDNVTGTTDRNVNVLPDCWRYINTGLYSANTGCPTVYEGQGYSANGLNSLHFYTTKNGSSGDQFAVLPPIDITQHPINTLQLTFMGRSQSTSNTNQFFLLVGVLGVANDPYTMMVVDTFITNSSTYQPVTVRFDNFAGVGKYIVLVAPKPSSGSNAGYVDSLVLSLLPCAEPTALTVSGVSAVSAQVGWSAGDATAWNLQYKSGSGNWSASVPLTAPSYTLTGLQPGTAYQVRVQTNCGNGSVSEWVTQSFTTEACAAPSMPVISNITATTATATWTAGSGETDWSFEYKPTSASEWNITIPVHNTPTYSMNSLTASTSYDVRVKGVCGTGSSDWSPVQTFTTETAPVCPAPTNLGVSDITKNSVVLDWTQTGSVTNWTVNYKEVAAANWSTATATTHPYTLTGLEPETAYSVYVVANCTEDSSEPSNTVNFSTLPDGIADYELGITLYPNPNNGQFTVNRVQGTVDRVQVYDVYGKLLKTVEVNGNTVELDVRELSAGMYFVRIHTEKGVVTKNFVKK